MKWFAIGYILFSVFMFQACQENPPQDSETPAPEIEPEPEPVRPRKVSWEEMEAGKLDVGTPIIVDAYVGSLPGFLTLGRDFQDLDMYPRRNQAGGYHLVAEVPVGSGVDQVAPLPTSFQQSDLQIRTGDSTFAGVAQPIRLHGTWQPDEDPKMDRIRVDSTDFMDLAFDERVFSTAQALTDSIIADSTFDGGYVYLDGKLTMPWSLFSVFSDRYSIIVTADQTEEISTVSIRIGQEPSTMDTVPPEYDRNDMVLRDYNGKVHKGESRYRIYGTFNRYEDAKVDLPGKFEAEELVKE